jgi:hypothetical protein
MFFCSITACMSIEEKDAPEVQEALLSFIDSLVVKKHIRVFDSDVSTERLADVPNAEEIRSEMPDG